MKHMTRNAVCSVLCLTLVGSMVGPECFALCKRCNSHTRDIVCHGSGNSYTGTDKRYTPAVKLCEDPADQQLKCLLDFNSTDILVEVYVGSGSSLQDCLDDTFEFDHDYTIQNNQCFNDDTMCSG
jgi:hypothetical protein